MKETVDGRQPSARWDVAGHSEVYQTLGGIPETHLLALLYESRHERLDVSLSFLQRGLDSGERCLYVARDLSRQAIVDGLAALGIDPEAALDCGQLVIATHDGTDSGFDADDVATRSVEAIEASSADGYPGLRVTGKLARHDSGTQFEERIGPALESADADFEFSALSQFDIGELSDEQIIDVVRVYPKFVYRRRVCDNPFYRPSDERDGADTSTLAADRVLETTHSLTGAREAIEQREQRVGVLNRVLRHNLRNELSVIRSHAELIDNATDDPELLESVAAILDAGDRLMDISDDAKRVERTVSGSAPARAPVNLKHLIDRAATRIRDCTLDVAVTSTVDDSAWIEGNEELEFALAELFEALAETAGEGAKIVTDIDEACSTNGRLCLAVRCERADLPEADVRALVQGRETPLSHGDGLGLWLVNWIVELSGGTLSFRNDEVLVELVAA